MMRFAPWNAFHAGERSVLMRRFPGVRADVADDAYPAGFIHDSLTTQTNVIHSAVEARRPQAVLPRSSGR